MWKYVSRRVKDTLERTCNVLDVGRTSFCSSGLSDSGQAKDAPHCSQPSTDNQVLVFKKDSRCLKWFRTRSSRFSGGQGKSKDERADQEWTEKERLGYQDGMAHSWVSALTWSSAIVCGWYTSQYMCLRRKRMGWTPHGTQAGLNHSSCVYGNVLMNTTRSLHSNVTSRIAFAAPPSPPSSPSPSSSSSSVDHLEETFQNHPIRSLLQNVNNPNSDTRESKKSHGDERWSYSSSSRSKSGRSSSSLDSAVADFSVTIGEIEYQFAVQDLTNESYKSAVQHLKLATTHHHPAGTFNLGLCYEMGMGVEKDLKMAMHCYSLASSLGHAKAMYNLGVFYVRGWGGLKRSHKAARECFDSAARLGQPEAQLALDRFNEKQLQRRHRELERNGMEPKLMSATGGAQFGVPAF